jgi:PAS domain S-box-containing protein
LAGEIAGLGYWTNDLVKNKIIWSDEIYKIFEVDKNRFDLNLENIKELFHPDEHQNFNPNFYRIFDDETIKEVERRIQTDSGKIKWVLERQYLIKDQNNNPLRLEGIAYDITNRKIHEQELLESNERFKILAKATVEAIIDWDIKNHTVFWGEGFHTLLGYDLSENNDKLWSNNIHPEDRERVLNNLNGILEDPAKEYFISEYRFLKANGDVAFVQHKGILIRDKSGKATRIVAAMIDLTEALSRLNKIENQNKALKEISWTQSHIVRAPLANIMGLIFLLKENNNMEVKDEQLIALISESAEKLDQIIREIVKKTSEIEEM